MSNDRLADGIRGAVGVHSMYLAAKHDENLTGRFSHLDGDLLVDGNTKATRRSIANVMVYMAGKYGQHLTIEEVEMGLLAAVSTSQAAVNGAEPVSNEIKTGPDYDALGQQYADTLEHKLTSDDGGIQIMEIIERFDLHGRSGHGLRTIEQSVGVALRKLGWTRKRQMIDGDRAYRWYPPESELKAGDTIQLPPVTPDDRRKEYLARTERAQPADEWDEEIALGDFVSEPDQDDGKRKQASGVQPNEHMAEKIRGDLFSDDAGITHYSLALHYYDFNSHEMDVPKSEDELNHKVKLAVGATMKSLGWKYKRKMHDGVSTKGFYPPLDWPSRIGSLPVGEPIEEPVEEPIEELVEEEKPIREDDADNVILRKKEDPAPTVEEPVEEIVESSLPRLSESTFAPYVQTDGTAHIEGTEPVKPKRKRKKAKKVKKVMDKPVHPEPLAHLNVPTEHGEWKHGVAAERLVKIVNLDEGTEDVSMETIMKKPSGDNIFSHFMLRDGEPDRLLKYDEDEDIWTATISTEEA